MVKTYSRAKVQGQRSVGSEDTVETIKPTDGQRDGSDCFTSLANAIITKQLVITQVVSAVTLCIPCLKITHFPTLDIIYKQF